MSKSNLTKKALISSVIALLLCATMLLGITFAWFTDTVTSSGNIIKSGDLEVSLLWAKEYAGEETDWVNVEEDDSAIFNYDLWEPGYSQVRYVKIANTGNLALKYMLNIVPEGEVDGLAEVIDVYFAKVDDDFEAPDEFADVDESLTKVGTLADLIADPDGAAYGVLLPEEGLGAEDVDEEEALALNAETGSVTVCLVLHMQESAGNEYENMSIGGTFDITLYATQFTYENDSFGNDYDEDASLDDVMIERNIELTDDSHEPIEVGEDESFKLDLGAHTLYNTLINNGILDASNGAIVTPDAATGAAAVAFKNYGNATLSDIEMVGGSAGDYANILYAGSVTVYNNVSIIARGGGIGLTGGAKAIFNGSSVYVDSSSTSGRYLFYLTDAGSELTINGGTFSWDKNDNQKRAYIYAGPGTTVYINGGTFGPASTRNGYTDGILGNGTVIITGGTFGFNPSKWLAQGYVATESNGTWIVTATN